MVITISHNESVLSQDKMEVSQVKMGASMNANCHVYDLLAPQMAPMKYLVKATGKRDPNQIKERSEQKGETSM